MVDEGHEREVEAGELPDRFADDRFYRALAAQPRRRTLGHLLACDRCTVDELVDVLCGWEATTDRVVGPERALQYRIELIHRHLPVLEAAGLVSYDRSTDEVAVEPLAESVERLVRRSIEAE